MQRVAQRNIAAGQHLLMAARAYEIVVLSASGRTKREIIAHSSVQAGRDGLSMVPNEDAASSFVLICKPLARPVLTKGE